MIKPPPLHLGSQKIGLPDGHGFPVLVYHPPTGSVIAHTRPLKSSLPCRRLSLRQVNETRYRPIGDFPPSVSVESLVLHPQLPLLFFITFVWSKHVNGPVGGYWVALHRFDLNTLQSEIVARRGELVLPDGYQTAWLNELFSASDDGNTLFCKAGLRNGEPVRYCLSKLSIPDRKLAIITRLEAVFA
jgi:hypothetical protein